MKSIDTKNWKKFLMSDLFVKLDLRCLKNDWKKAFDISKEKTPEFNLPLVNAKNNNNGIMYYGREKDFETAEMTLDVVMDGAASTGNVYAQPQKTGVLYNAYLIKPKVEITKYVLLFLSLVIQKQIKVKYGYDNKAGWDNKIEKEKILLPAKAINNVYIPDWEYMDSFMKRIMNDAQSKLDILLMVCK